MYKCSSHVDQRVVEAFDLHAVGEDNRVKTYDDEAAITDQCSLVRALDATRL